MNFYNRFLCFWIYWISAAIKTECLNFRQKGVNLAYLKAAKQSSNFWPRREARLAVDGIAVGDYRKKSCTATRPLRKMVEGKECWWEVDLKGNYRIGHINILNRNECCPQRLHDFWIEVAQLDFHDGRRQLCYVFPGKATFGWLNVSCIRPIQGRVVRLTKPMGAVEDLLTLCEVEISETFETNTQLNWKMKGVADMRLSSDDLQVFTRTSLVGCAIRCTTSPPCFAYNFRQDYTCEIVSNPRAKRRETPGYKYYSLQRIHK